MASHRETGESQTLSTSQANLFINDVRRVYEKIFRNNRFDNDKSQSNNHLEFSRRLSKNLTATNHSEERKQQVRAIEISPAFFKTSEQT